MSSTYRHISAQRTDEFVARGYKRRHFFPHRVYQLPKCGPDAFMLAEWMCGIDDPAAMWELVLYAEAEVRAEFPPELFFDDDVIWHQQQFGRPGQVATASIVVDGDTINSITHVSDLFQRISRRRAHKTRVEKVFAGWNHMLLNAVLAFAIERGARRVRVPHSALAGRHTDRSRNIDFTIFERIYDRTVNSVFAASADGEWWVLDLDRIRERVVLPERRTEPTTATRTICICHDVERGLGHRDVDPGFARRAELSSARDLERIRELESKLGVHATYCVVGLLMDELLAGLRREGHCVAFHSFDHRPERDDQLLRCRKVDYRIKGYRPPNSRITPELTDRNLLWRNFEWLASAPASLDASEPTLRAGVVRLPIEFDDFPLHTGALAYRDWERAALALASENDFTAISLHDCYAPHWLPHYRGFIERMGELGEYRTLDEVAATTTLRSAV